MAKYPFLQWIFHVFTRRLDDAKWSVFQAEFWSWFNVAEKQRSHYQSASSTKVDSLASSVAADDDDDDKKDDLPH